MLAGSDASYPRKVPWCSPVRLEPLGVLRLGERGIRSSHSKQQPALRFPFRARPYLAPVTEKLHDSELRS